MAVPRQSFMWTATNYAFKAVNVPEAIKDKQRLWYHGKEVIAQSQDVCPIGSWIYAASPFSVNSLSHTNLCLI